MYDVVLRRAFLVILLTAAFLLLAESSRAQVTASTSQLDFGSVYLGISVKQSLTITNTGTIPVFLYPPSLGGDFSYQSNCPFYTAASPDTFAVGAVCSFEVDFTPLQVGAESQTLSIPVYWQQPDYADLTLLQSVNLNLTGTGLMPVKISPALLDFGYVTESQLTASMPVTFSNAGNIGVNLIQSSLNGVRVTNQTCQLKYGYYIPAGQSCTMTVAVYTNATGAQMLQYSFDVYNNDQYPQILGQISGTVKFYGHPLSVYSPGDFGLVLIGTSLPGWVQLWNHSTSVVNVFGIVVSGDSFSQTSSCIGSLAPGAICYVSVTYTPTRAVKETGSLTVTSDDPTSPQSVPLTGTGTAVKIVEKDSAGNSTGDFDFSQQDLDTSSPASQVILTNTGPVDLTLQGINVSSDDFLQKNNCKKTVAPGASCTINLSFDPEADGFRQGELTVTEQDPASPQKFNLSGYGVGIGHQTVYVHYDYMVAPDHTDDPEVVAPGALQRVVDSFAFRGVDLVIDPQHTAIPAVPVLDFDGYCRQYPEFSDLVAGYFTPKHPDQHYVLFADAYASLAFDCYPTSSTGISELPGEHFLVTLRPAVLQGFSEYALSVFYSGAFMHELGHNFGLHHGGGIGPYGDETNFKPNFLSIMNYYFNLNGIPEGDAVGSLNLRQCSADPDCPSGDSCLHYSSTSGACYRIDYSDQVLPTGGNTPGALDERNLNEPAGLGSGGTDVTFFESGCGYFDDMAASDGPIDWNENGDPTETSVAVTLDYGWNGGNCSKILMGGYNDWASLLGTGENDSEAQNMTGPSGISPGNAAVPELDLETAKRMHVLLPLRPAPVVIEPECQAPGKPVLPYRAGIVTVALLATGDFDVSRVDLSSLDFHHAKPVNTWFQDINGDGKSDLVMQFRGSDVRLSKQATKAHLTGWLKNSQAFVGERDITIASSPTAFGPNCTQ